MRADFDGDGYTDFAIAAPGGTVNGRSGAGYFTVVYGMADGPRGVKRQVISQDRYGIPGTAETGDRFGSDLTAADLDGDGFTDLVVGAPGEDIGSVRDAGRHTVLWGSVGGLIDASVIGDGRSETRAGDFDGDGHLDLATAGRMRYGPFGRTGEAARTGPLVDLDVRLYAMEAGDVDGDGRTDLVVSSGSWDSDAGGRCRRRTCNSSGAPGKVWWRGRSSPPPTPCPRTASPSATSTATAARMSSSAAVRRRAAASWVWCGVRRAGSPRGPR